MLTKFTESFYNNFIADDNWKYLTSGLANTLLITVVAVAIGIVLGFLIAVIRTAYDNRKADPNARKNFGSVMLAIGNAICKIYLAVIRGTPVALQLLIIYFGTFASVDISKMFVAFIAFGVNSGAYVAEIFRSGIMSIDRGQMEAGRSVGLNYVQTMTSIIMPQAFKNVLPALLNEFIALLKETSIAGYIALNDLTRGAYIIRSNTFSGFMPLAGAAVIYLVIVLLMSKLTGLLERRLRSSDH